MREERLEPDWLDKVASTAAKFMHREGQAEYFRRIAAALDGVFIRENTMTCWGAANIVEQVVRRFEERTGYVNCAALVAGNVELLMRDDNLFSAAVAITELLQD